MDPKFEMKGNISQKEYKWVILAWIENTKRKSGFNKSKLKLMLMMS